MKIMTLIILFVILLINFQISAAAENKYGIVKAWFNGENATVEGIKLKIGEPAEIKVEVTSKIDGHVFVELTEPGVTKAFNVLEGIEQEKSIDNLKIEKGWSKIFSWKIAPNGAWKNGNAPINIIVQFHNLKSRNDEIIQFSIANPYILDEQYTGAVSTTTAVPKGTNSVTPVKTAPSTSILIVLAMLLMARRWQR